MKPIISGSKDQGSSQGQGRVRVRVRELPLISVSREYTFLLVSLELSSVFDVVDHNVSYESKKQDTLLLPITAPKVN